MIFLINFILFFWGENKSCGYKWGFILAPNIPLFVI